MTLLISFYVKGSRTHAGGAHTLTWRGARTYMRAGEAMAAKEGEIGFLRGFNALESHDGRLKSSYNGDY